VATVAVSRRFYALALLFVQEKTLKVAQSGLQPVAKLLVGRGARLCAQKWLNISATGYKRLKIPMQIDQILAGLEKLGSPEVKKTKERFAITAQNSHGIFLTDLKSFAKQIGRNDDLALELFDTGIYEARLLTSMLFNPKNLTEPLMEKWVKTFENWEICDTFCMGFMGKSKFVLPKAFEWVEYQPEYQKRAGFVLMVAYAFTDTQATNEVIRSFFPPMLKHATDERKYVMKGINWALRQVGKRNQDLHKESLAIADQILALGTKPARWIARDAIRQLQSSKVYFKNYPKAIYGNSNES
jgi:3-methyladenine DNA glycosylase AlkD